MKALVGLCAVLYKSLPTTIQQDRALLAGLEQGNPASLTQQQQQQDSQQDDELYQTAVQYRLGHKLLLEMAAKQLIQRLQQLSKSA